MQAHLVHAQGEIMLAQLLILQLLLCLIPPSSSKHLSPSVFEYPTVSYPFGFQGSSRPGFEVFVRNGSYDLMLSLRSGDYPIQEVSLLHGYVHILGGIISRRCYGDSSTGEATKESGWIDLDGTPYTLSDTRNKLTVIGCDDLVLIRGSGGGGNQTSGCVSFCSTLDDVIDWSCSGLGCCQAAIPRGLKSFHLQFNSTRELTRPQGRNLTKCSEAFFVEQEKFEFSNANLRSTMVRDIYYPVVLDWAIGNKSCQEEISSPNTTLICSENSFCYDSPNGVGYRCNCSDGYMANPYIQGGCEDINECYDPETNPCVGRCINTLGNVSCSCPHGKIGDGRKNGSGCKRASALDVALGVGLVFLFILMTGSFWSYWALKKRAAIKLKEKFFQQNGGFLLQQHISSNTVMGSTAKIFTAEELQRATNNFDANRILGRGGFGTVYKGILPDQEVVAIKKSKDSEQADESQIEQFINEVVILSQINHRNVVRLLGCCLETQVPLLVYEFISNGTLFQCIHGHGHFFSMSWEGRLRIAAETAGALAYLHSAAAPIPIVHRDIKSANILLDENYTAKVSDFGASRPVPFDQTHVTTLVQGTFGYLDPEYFHTSQLTEKSDVYSFGVVLVELLTGEKPISLTRSEEERNLAAHFVLLVDENRLREVLEPNIVEEAGVEPLFMVAQLARRCLSLKGGERPTMKEVAMELEGGLRWFKLQHLVQPNHEETICLLGEPSNLHVAETSRQYSLENQMLSSIGLPR